MMQYIIDIEKGGSDYGPTQLVCILHDNTLHIRQLKGRALLPHELVAIISGSEEFRYIRQLAEEEATPIRIQSREGGSGCMDYYFIDIIKGRECNLHVSMYRRLNEGVSIPIWALCTVINFMNNKYGYSTLVKYSIKETSIVFYDNMFPWRPFRGIDEQTETEMDDEI